MFDRLEDLLVRYEEVMSELGEPGTADNQERFRKLMKEQSDLTPIVEAFREYKKCKQDIEDILLLMNHINSIKRSSLKGKSPYECVYTDDYEMHKLMNILKMDIIPPDDVLMKPELFNINR